MQCRPSAGNGQAKGRQRAGSGVDVAGTAWDSNHSSVSLSDHAKLRLGPGIGHI